MQRAHGELVCCIPLFFVDGGSRLSWSVGAEAWLQPRPPPVRRVALVSVVASFKHVCRFCAVSCEEYVGRLMARCRNGGGCLEGVG